jgi:hypothetical protein
LRLSEPPCVCAISNKYPTSSLAKISTPSASRFARTSSGEINFAAVCGAIFGSGKTSLWSGKKTIRPIACRYCIPTLNPSCESPREYLLKSFSSWMGDSLGRVLKSFKRARYDTGILLVCLEKMRLHSFSTSFRRSCTLFADLRELTWNRWGKIGRRGYRACHASRWRDFKEDSGEVCKSDFRPTSRIVHLQVSLYVEGPVEEVQSSRNRANIPAGHIAYQLEHSDRSRVNRQPSAKIRKRNRRWKSIVNFISSLIIPQLKEKIGEYKCTLAALRNPTPKPLRRQAEQSHSRFQWCLLYLRDSNKENNYKCKYSNGGNRD